MTGGSHHIGQLDGRTALVTGGASGIGLACVRSLAAAGALVHVVDRDGPGARKAAEEIGGVAHEVDLADAEAITRLPRTVDVLVNNAGLQHVAPVHEYPAAKFALIQQVMVTAPFLLAKHCLPHMYERGWGRVVHVSSVHGLRASAFKVAYVTAKHGLEGMSKVIALEGAEHGVTSNCVNPGYVRTPLVTGQIAAQAASHGIDEDEVTKQILLQRSAIKKLITPEDVAATVLWLCEDHAAHITGTSIPLDGGWTAS